MATINIYSGLGNQLFQYALGRKLSIIYNESLIFDKSRCNIDSARQFQLDNFNVTYSELPPPTLKKYHREHSFIILLHRLTCNPILLRLFGINYYTTINVNLRKALNRIFKNVFLEEGTLYSDSVFKIGHGRYITGQWQSEKYFSDIDNIIRSDLKCNFELSPQNNKYLEAINSNNSVAVHVRRGDFSSNPWYYNMLELDYYKKAFSYIADHVISPHFFIFSNDLLWCQNNFDSPSLTFVTGNDEMAGLQDFILMTKCKHHIIANSTFSWWGAWLAESDEQIVVAPHHSRWLKNVDCRDMILERWIQI